MTVSPRDKRILEHILSWCVQNTEAHQQYQYSRQAFDQISAYRNAVSIFSAFFGLAVIENLIEEKGKLCYNIIVERE